MFSFKQFQALQERDTMYKLRHPNLVPIYDSGMFQTLPGPGSGKGLNMVESVWQPTCN